MTEPEHQSVEQTDEVTGLRVDLYFWLQALVVALVSLILAFTFLGRIIGVDGDSMVPTLHDGDLLILQSIAYTPAQGDVVVLTQPSYGDIPIVKRVIAVGGQTVDIDYDTNTVTVDGVALEEDYINEVMMALPMSYATHVEVPEGSIFVMGDNRNHSTDSRSPDIGTVELGRVMGCARFILFPFADFGWIS